MYGTRILLPGGFWVDDVCHREAELRPLSGDDEVFLGDAGESLLPPQKATALLARSLTRLGPLTEITPDSVRSLAVGDREALLLHLRRLTFGEHLQCVLTCPECGEKMDLELNISDLLVPASSPRKATACSPRKATACSPRKATACSPRKATAYEHGRSRHELTVSTGEETYRARFHLPTGADAEAIARLAQRDPRAAAGELLGRCVEVVTLLPVASGDDRQKDDGQVIEQVPPAVSEAITAKLSELDPQAELVLNLACPECSHAFSALLDAGTFLFQELAVRVKRLYREVHLLAFHYHWSEADILRLTAAKRQRYLGLLSEAVAS